MVSKQVLSLLAILSIPVDGAMTLSLLRYLAPPVVMMALERAEAAGMIQLDSDGARMTRSGWGASLCCPSPSEPSLMRACEGPRRHEVYGMQLARMRQSAGCTAATLAAHLGVSRQCVSRWESGGCGIPPKHIPSLESFFGVVWA